ncbi:MAG: two-component system response regulator [Candidatus Cloacimonadota bacterium]|nr:MAG: two-component system response regulator [Candidatus Cloacimonadota bacterium]
MSMKKLIAILDDEPDILNLVSINLERSGFETAKFEIADELSKFLEKKIPDLIILDLMLPDADGFDVCKDLKKDERFASIPIIMLTAKGDETDRILGLEFGADDYVVKPFSPRELVARVKAVLRRGKVKEEAKKIIEIGRNLRIDLQKYEVYLNDKKLNLTSTEFKIIKLLATRKGWVYSRNQILDHLWGNDKIVVDRTVDVHIRNLRTKLGPAGKYIKNIRSIGYKIEE